MEQGKLRINRSKTGKVEVIIFTDDQKKLFVYNAASMNADFHGRKVEFERENGNVTRINCDGNEIYPIKTAMTSTQKQSPALKASGKKASPIENTPFRSDIGGVDGLIIDHLNEVLPENATAKAPYNFIPLNRIVVFAEPVPNFDKYQKDRLTGWIDLHIEALTPLYIRDAMTLEELRKQEEEQGERFISSDFFSPGGTPAIPGSSLRGMVRTLVEIAAHGRFGSYQNKYLYFRGLADTSNLQNEYRKQMLSEEKKGKGRGLYKMNAGFIFKKGFHFFIERASKFEQIKREEARSRAKNLGIPYQAQSFFRAGEDWIVVSGDMKGKKRDWIIKPAREPDVFQIPDEDVDEYRNDSTRGTKIIDILKKGETEKTPCFYVRWKDSNGEDRITFGHTGMFRIAYKKSIGDHIPYPLLEMSYHIDEEVLGRLRHLSKMPEDVLQSLAQYIGLSMSSIDLKKNLKNNPEWADSVMKYAGKWDIAEGIFGNADSFSGRVFFEDAIMMEGEIENRWDIPQALLGPKPTSFQHYLVQVVFNLKNRKHYNDDTSIRGNKLYWHKKENNWRENDEKKRQMKNVITKIKPAKTGAAFSGRIRFENLSQVELGALLFVLDLPKNCAHKLGMGKPLGLGSVKITPSLHLSDRQKRYSDLLAEWGETPSASPDDSGSFVREFEIYVLNVLGEAKKNLWDIERMKELKIMLDVEKGTQLNKQDKIRYLEVERGKSENVKGQNEYKERPILPLPSRV